METPRQRFITRHQALKRIRAPWDEDYRQIGDYLLPWRLKFNPLDTRRQTNDRIIDPTGTLALRTCAAGLSAGTCSASRIWFRYGAPAALLARDRRLAEKTTVKRFLSMAEEVSRDLLLRSNFYGVTSGHAFYDAPAFGQFAMGAWEDPRTVVRFQPWSVGSYCLQMDAYGEYDTSYREQVFTVAQMVQAFGLERCSSVVRDQWRRHQYDVQHVILHVIEPNRRDEETGFEGTRAGRWGWEGMAFRSVWLEKSREDQRDIGFLRCAGFRSFPVIAFPWARSTPEDVYGTGPGRESLSDVKELQTLARRKLQMIDKQSLPATYGPELTNGVPSQLPGQYTAVPGGGPGDAIKPVYVPDARAVEQVRLEIQEKRLLVREGLFADLWRIITDDERTQPPTAEEVRAKREERLLQLGPTSNNIERGYLRRTLDRTYELGDEAGFFEDAPEELSGLDLKVEFLSVFGEAQKAQEIPAVERVSAFVKALAELDEEVVDNLDADAFAKKYSEISGLPPDLFRTPEAVQALRESRDQKRQALEAAQSAQAGAATAKDLSQASLENDNAFARIVGQFPPIVGAQAGVSPPGATGGLAVGANP